MTAPLDLALPGHAPGGTIVVGLDLSLTATGIAHLTPTGAVVDTIRGKGTGITRLRALAREIRDLCTGATLVVIEGPAYHQASGAGYHERAGLHWMVLDRLHWAEVPSVVVSTSVMKKYATGKGSGKKGPTIDAAIRRYPEVDTAGDDNACDALWLAALGLDHLTGIHRVPESHRVVLSSVDWPVRGAA